ncbi:MAG: phospholipid carrier-dependent glycosyltransferase, partial [Chloroflexi bacterium]|nr:phospholipid carrier-dependent glycosyltransferase [Chloroflexota bacterium]
DAVAALGAGHRPTRRDFVLALAVALAVLATRGYRLDQPREMYFDEVYHARTAFELLAERDPYEWTHPHLAKEVMALGILAFGSDVVTGREALAAEVTALAVANDGTRVFAAGAQGQVFLRSRAGTALPGGAIVGERVRALAVDSDRVLALTARSVVEISRSPNGTAAPRARDAGVGDTVALHLDNERIAVAGANGVAIWPNRVLDGAPRLVRLPAVAMTGRPDGGALYVLATDGAVHEIEPRSGDDRRQHPVGGGRALAYVQGAERVLVAKTDAPDVASIDLQSNAIATVPLANARTGDPAGIRTLATVPRSAFVYGATGDAVVVIEPHGVSPFASIPARGALLGVDGEGDTLVVADETGAASRIETGRHALAWRLPGVLAGSLLAFVMVLLARRLFAARAVAIITGIVVVLDGSMFAMPRIGMNDVYLALFIVLGWYFVVAAHDPRRSWRMDVVLAGACFGLAFATKWAGAYAIAGVLVASIAVTARAAWRGEAGTGGPLDLLAAFPYNAALLFVSFAVVPIGIYLAAYLPWFGGPMIPYGWDLAELTRQMYSYHSGLTSPHPAGSPWWSWPLMLKPVYWYYGQTADGQSAVIYEAGNIVLYWAALPATVWLAMQAVRSRSARAGLAPYAMAVQLIAWMPISRVLFFYHFFTALPFYLIALAAALAALWRRGERTVVVATLGLAAAAFLFFYPFVSGQPVPAAQASMFFVLPTWHYDCQFYPSDGGPFRCDVGAGGGDPAALLTRVGLAAGLVAVAGGLGYLVLRLTGRRAAP